MRLFAGMFATLAVAVVVAPMSVLPETAAAQTVVKAPAPRAKHHETPKVEVFLGYSRFGTGSNNTVTGNRMVGLNGGSASVAFNFNRYLGIVGDFGGYDDSQLQLTGSGVNQPLVVNSSGTAYTYLFGPRLSFRNQTRFTPFAQVLAGGVHASAVTVNNCAGAACAVLPVQSSFAFTGGGGLDIRLTHRISIRAVQAEYMLTRFDGVVNGVSTGSSASQNDLRLSSGLLFAFSGRPALPPVQLACSVQPGTVFSGDPVTATATATNLNPKRKAVYSWTTSGGAVSGTDSAAAISTAGLAPGSYTVSGHISQGEHGYEQAGCTAGFTVRPFDPPTVSCSANPSSVMPGDSATITAQATSPQNRPLSYSYSASGGAISGTTSSASLNTSGIAPSTITVTCNAVDDLGKTATATTNVSVNAPPVSAAPQPSNLCAISFERDRKRPVRVDNEAKACLDDIALQMQRASEGKLVIVGNYSNGETPKMAADRAINERRYLTEEKGIDAARIEPRVGSAIGRTTTNTFVPSGATYNQGDSTAIPQH
jgi:opacity protein-like surface antigen